MTPEQKQEALRKAQEARRTNSAARKASTLRRDFADANYWEELAKDNKLRLPAWGQPCTITKMRQWLNKVGWTQGRCEEWLGCKLADFAKLNPEWPTRAFAGLILEQIEEI